MMSIELVKAFIKKMGETCALTDDDLDLVTGGRREETIAFLESYCKKITNFGAQEECYATLAALRESS